MQGLKQEKHLSGHNSDYTDVIRLQRLREFRKFRSRDQLPVSARQSSPTRTTFN